MKVVTAGMYRSGTTWQFNAVRIILEQAFGEEAVYSSWVDYYDPNDPRPIHLIKTHKRRKVCRNADVVFSTDRDKDEIKASMQRRADFFKKNPNPQFSNEANLDKFEEWMAHAYFWQRSAHYVQDFEDIKKRPEILIEIYATHLGVSVDIDEVLNEMKLQMKIPQKGADSKTLLHAGHITKG